MITGKDLSNLILNIHETELRFGSINKRHNSFTESLAVEKEDV